MRLHSNAVCIGLVVAILSVSAAAAEGTESRYNEDYPQALSKKGLQVELVDDALELGIKHAAINVDLCSLVTFDAVDDAPVLGEVSDRRIYIRSSYLSHLDRSIKALSDHGVLVNLILLTYQSHEPEVNNLLIHPACEVNAPNRLGAFNTTTADSRAALQMVVEYLAERWGRTDRQFGRVVGWIVGNEVNSHWWWSNMGRVTMQEFADQYLLALRTVHQAVRSQTSWGRIYVSLEHHWTIRYAAGDDLQAFPARDFLEYLNAQASGDPKLEWHVAFHPYPENLFEPRFWLDESATQDFDTPRITFKNINMLPSFLAQERFSLDSKQRHIILSEQGFHTPDTPEGENLQAAAYCLAYRKVDQLAGIDAFILHRHVDHPAEGGLWLGLRRRSSDPTNPHPKKKIYECFQYADTAKWPEVFEFALPIIAQEQW